MATHGQAGARDGADLYEWLSGLGAGLIGSIVAGLVIQFGFDATVLSEGIPASIGREGFAAGWVLLLLSGAILGLIYAGVARIETVRAYAILPGSGAWVGLLYGLVIWVIAVVVVPLWLGDGLGAIGTYAVNLQGVLSFALLGLVTGVAYGASPVTE